MDWGGHNWGGWHRKNIRVGLRWPNHTAHIITELSHPMIMYLVALSRATTSKTMSSPWIIHSRRSRAETITGSNTRDKEYNGEEYSDLSNSRGRGDEGEAGGDSAGASRLQGELGELARKLPGGGGAGLQVTGVLLGSPCARSVVHDESEDRHCRCLLSFCGGSETLKPRSETRARLQLWQC